MQLVSDVPVGVFLSGGIDSSTTAAIATRVLERRLPSFTMGFDDEDSDERAYARATSQFLGTLAHEEVLTQDAALRLIPDFVALHDEPFFDHSSLPDARGGAARAPLRRPGDPLGRRRGRALRRLPLVRGRARRADARLAAAREAAARRGRRPARRASREREPARIAAPPRSCWSTPAASIRCSCCAASTSRRAPRVTRLQLADLHTFLVDDVLLKVDHASMACGVEVRVPFLDHELVELAFSIDSRVLFARGERKALLKRAAASWLPPEILTEPQEGLQHPARRLVPAGPRASRLARCCPTACWSRTACCAGRRCATRWRRSAARCSGCCSPPSCGRATGSNLPGRRCASCFRRWRARREAPLPLARQPALEVGAHLPGDEDGRGARRPGRALRARDGAEPAPQPREPRRPAQLVRRELAGCASCACPCTRACAASASRTSRARASISPPRGTPACVDRISCTRARSSPRSAARRAVSRRSSSPTSPPRTRSSRSCAKPPLTPRCAASSP